MPKILRPLDWQVTSGRPLFVVDSSDMPPGMRVNVALAPEYFASGLSAKVWFSAPLAEASVSATARAHDPLPDGQYVVYLTHASSPESVLAVSGLWVKDSFRHIDFPLRDAKSERAFRAVTLPAELRPVPIKVAHDGSVPRRLNIVIPSLEKANFSGGPNTALALGQVLAERGIPVSFISSETGVEPDLAALRQHLALLTGIANPRTPVTFIDGHDQERAVVIGRDDIMLGTAWWTVQKFRHCLRELKTPRFVYLIQEFEPALYPHSTSYALAAETYALDHLPLYNHKFLYDYFRSNRIGNQAAGEGAWFDPVMDNRRFFFDEAARRSTQRTLLFYSRPKMAVRNLHEIGYAALANVVGERVLDQNWKLYSMGESAGHLYLPHDMIVEELPWMSFEQYCAQMRSCDILLSLMLSPHPSYPPLEGAASGAIVVTNHFANKTPAEFARVSGNIIAVEPSVDGVSQGLRQAAARLGDMEARRRESRTSSPRDWVTALSSTADRIVAFWEAPHA
jgi:O-antigen biosynthesis protein